MEAREVLGKVSPIAQPVMGGWLTSLLVLLELQLEGVGVGGATEVELGKIAEDKRAGVVVVDISGVGHWKRRCGRRG